MYSPCHICARVSRGFGYKDQQYCSMPHLIVHDWKDDMSFIKVELQAKRAAWKAMQAWAKAHPDYGFAAATVSKEDALQLMEAMFAAYHKSLEAAAAAC